MRAFLLSSILLFAGASAAMAQDSYNGDAAAAYHWVRANAGPGQCGCFGMNGGGLSGSWNFHTSWSAVADFSAEHIGKAPVTGNSLTPSRPPMGSSAAATCTSAWVSTPPVIERVSTMDNAIPFLRLKGWHAPAGRRTCETLASDPGQADQTGNAGGCQKNWDPADRSFRRTARAASADSEVRPGPRLPGPTRPSHQDRGSRAGSTTHTLPADSARVTFPPSGVAGGAPITRNAQPRR